MATKPKTKTATKASAGNAKARPRSTPKAAPKAAPKSGGKEAPRAARGPGGFTLPNAAQLADYAKTLTPEQAFELYRANARLALDVIDAAIESTAKMRRLQFEGEETARTIQKKAARRAAEAGDVPALMAAGQSVTQEALERSMAYWGQMFELVVEIQKRLFALMENQMADMPGVKQAKAALTMMPDMTQLQKVVSAMQGVMSSGGSAFESMQKVMSDFARMSGVKR
jgi:phasin family protein